MLADFASIEKNAKIGAQTMPSPHPLYLVGPRDPATESAAMTEFRDALDQVEGAEYVRAGASGFLVARLSPAALGHLGQRFSSLIIEPDAPLSL